jgi:polysaccharide biosynthesis/export protein
MKDNQIAIYIVFILTILSLNSLCSQDKKERMGSEDIIRSGANYYNYADKEKVNIEISVWGYVKNPGRYLIPSGTTFVDLVALCGGPLNEAKMDKIKIIRPKNDSLNIKENKLFVLNYEDYLKEDNVVSMNKQNPVLFPGDIVLIPGGHIYTFRDNLGLILSIIGTLTSITVLVVTLIRY